MARFTAQSSVGTIEAPLPEPDDTFEGELLKCAITWLRDLPVATRFILEAPGIPVTIHCISARLAEGHGDPERPAQVFFDGDELHAIGIGVQAERLTSAELRGFCLLKLQDPGFRITEEIVLAGARASERERSLAWSLGRVLEQMGLRLRSADLLAATPTLRPSKPASRARYDDGSAPAAA